MVLNNKAGLTASGGGTPRAEELRLRFARSMRQPLQTGDDATLQAELGEPGPRRGLEPAMASGGHASLPGRSVCQLVPAMLVRARNELKRSNSSASMAEES